MTGSNADAINSAVGGNTVINSGTLLSRSAHAVRFTGSGNTLRVAGNSVLAGDIAMGTDASFGFAPGANSLHWNFDGTCRGIGPLRRREREAGTVIGSLTAAWSAPGGKMGRAA